MNDIQSNGLYIFRHDLRLDDNPCLEYVSAQCEALLCVYVIEDCWFQPTHYQSKRMGEHRYRFLLESLDDLHHSLQKHGHELLVIKGDFDKCIGSMIDAVKPRIIGMAKHCGSYELEQQQRIQQLVDNLGIEYCDTNAECLFSEQQLPFDLEDMPNVFSPFRKKIEKAISPLPPKAESFELPPQIQINSAVFDSVNTSFELKQIQQKSFDARLRGGSAAAKKQLNYYLVQSHHIQQYKQTRNGLEGWSFSSKLSAWLALGCISVRQVYDAIKRYETEVCANDSTYWLYFELLWRDFFHWQAYKHNKQLFTFSGIQQREPQTQFDQESFTRWCHGETRYEIVDACMRQLNQTGFMSNRGRQLVASCFVHELGLDWRYGAAYFEQQLIDYDVASNWGNWQYLAGVGSDPRGHRQFNLAKQTQQYDEDGSFRARWL
ncbi:DASH family cryptochrome [Alteromonas facilis]|uniref:DASH family cryptochrome n=1 Tax=Alteromonas facilis TaxID=2048004 RepID=UPI000C288CDD|nr:DASH family cryptochrome [Alteromonas facilis]